MKKIALLLSCFIMLSLAIKVEATESPDSQAIDFSAQAIPSDFQKEDRQELSYWWLDVSKEEEMVLYVEITNGQTENTFDISVNQAITNENLVIDYSLSSRESARYLASAPAFDFTQQVKIGEQNAKEKIQITLAPHESKRIPLTLDLSEKPVGQAIGGVNVTRHAKDAERTGSILNVYNRAFALVLDAGEGENLPVQLSLGKLEADEQTLVLTNPNAQILEDVSIEATITDSSGEKVSELQAKQGALVPQAKISFAMHNEKKLEQGEQYQLMMKVKMPEDKEDISLAYTLTVDEEGKVTAEAINAQPSRKRPLILLGLGIAAALFIFLVFRTKKNKFLGRKS